MTRPTAPPPRWRWPLAVALIAVAALPVVLRYLVFWPLDQWQVDVEVYRDAGVSILTGRPIYAAMTEPPQLLPFTYPPFAALVAMPLAWLPFGVIGWLWTAAQIAATTAIVWYAGWRLIHRAGPWTPLALAALTAPMLWLHPVADGIRFGQVNAFMVLACLMDLRRPRPGLLKHVPPGMLVGLAMSIKLTPGVFVIHYLINRRWREAATAVGTAVAVTLGAWALLPEASFAFWGGALQDPTRLGPNFGTSNQSIRGFLLRVGPDGVAGTAIWLLLVAIIGAFGFWLARRMYLRGNSIGEVAVVGLLACLLSPVAWIHHYHWIVVVIFALLGSRPWRGAVGADGRPLTGARGVWAGLRRSPRVVAALVVTVWFLMRMPWWGIHWLNQPDWPELPGRLLQNADVAGGLVALWLLWWVNREDDVRPDGDVQDGDGPARADLGSAAAEAIGRKPDVPARG